MKKVLLSVAGFDPTSGAGVVLDISVFRQLGYAGMGILTAVTVQNTASVRHIHPLTPQLVLEQHAALNRDVSAAGIKVGMIGSRGNLKAVVSIIDDHGGIPVVVDPVLRSSSGFPLLDPEAAQDLLPAIGSKATLLTPNLDEASFLAGFEVSRLEHMEAAARKIHAMAGCACLVKGGHLRSGATDVLFDGKSVERIGHEKVPHDVHGSGCFLSSAALAYLVRGKSVSEACRLAVGLTVRALRLARPVGKGRAVFSFPLPSSPSPRRG